MVPFLVVPGSVLANMDGVGEFYFRQMYLGDAWYLSFCVVVISTILWGSFSGSLLLLVVVFVCLPPPPSPLPPPLTPTPPPASHPLPPLRPAPPPPTKSCSHVGWAASRLSGALDGVFANGNNRGHDRLGPKTPSSLRVLDFELRD